MGTNARVAFWSPPPHCSTDLFRERQSFDPQPRVASRTMDQCPLLGDIGSSHNVVVDDSVVHNFLVATTLIRGAYMSGR